MESLRKPEVVMSTAALGASIGVGVYAYKKIGECQAQIVELEEHLRSTVKKVTEQQASANQIQELASAIRHLSQLINNQSRDIQELGRILDDQNDRVEAVEDYLVMVEQDLEGQELVLSRSFQTNRPDQRGRQPNRRAPKSKPVRPKKSVSFADSEAGDRRNDSTPLQPLPPILASVGDSLIDFANGEANAGGSNESRGRRHSHSRPEPVRSRPSPRMSNRRPEPEPMYSDEGSDDDIDDVIRDVHNGRR